MTISQISAKIDLRLNKGASGSYDNIWNYQKQEAFNKAVIEWVRRQKRGKNDTQEGGEETDARVDDLQVLLKPDTIAFRDKGRFVQTNSLPSDYLFFNRLTPTVVKGSCKGRSIKSHLREEGNVDELITICSFDFEETFHTIIGNKINLYHNKDFSVERIDLVYYRKPKIYNFKKGNTVVEFKDDVCEILADEASKIIASDIESFNAKTITESRSEYNN